MAQLDTKPSLRCRYFRGNHKFIVVVISNVKPAFVFRVIQKPDMFFAIGCHQLSSRSAKFTPLGLCAFN